jgi:hypothetical protein
LREVLRDISSHLQPVLKIYRITVILLTAFLLLANCGMYRTPLIGSREAKDDIKDQLVYLEARVHAGLGQQMQALFPEGSVFTHVLYGLTWCGYAQGTPDAELLKHALAEAEWAYSQLDDPGVKGRFPTVMEPRYGAFYAGWRNFLLVHIVNLAQERTAPRLIVELDAQSAELERAYQRSASPFLPSYDGLAWPADNVVAMASLAMYHQLRADEANGVIERWNEQAVARLDDHGCLPHAWDPLLDQMVEASRGSSMGLMNCFLPVIDSAFAKDQFGRYRDRFLDTRFGVPIVREYAKGAAGSGDVESGPVIFGAGSSAAIVGPGAFRMNGDLVHAQELDASIEGFGFPIGQARKRYLFGLMPIADLFIVWTRTMGDPVATGPQAPSFSAFHTWSIFLAALMWFPLLVVSLVRRSGG